MLSVNEKSYALYRNGISVHVEMWDGHKKPVLAVKVEKENSVYKVASFNSVETADWFVDKMRQFLDGLVKDGE